MADKPKHPVAMRTFAICVDTEIEDVIVKAEVLFYEQSTGWLQFRYDNGLPIAVFTPGKWLYFNEVSE